MTAAGAVTTRPVEKRSAATTLARASASRVGAELRVFFRDGMAVAFIFAFPVVMLLIFGSVFADRTAGPDELPFIQYFLAGMVATGVMLTSFQSRALSIADERDQGLLKRLRGTPMPPAAYLVGKVATVLLVGAVQTALTLATAVVVFDVDLPTDAGRWATFAWVYLLGTAAGSVLGIGVSALPRSAQEANAVITPIVIVLQFVSGVYFVFTDLPDWMQSVASAFPLRWMTLGMRSVFLPDSFAAAEPGGAWQHGLTALVLVAWVVVGTVLCLRTFRWTRRDAG
jgi:ABC-2 type transport system permease protein